ERSETGIAPFIELGESREIFRSTGAQPMINQAQLQFLCNAPHDGGFTHPRTGLHKRDQTSVQTFGYELPYLTWGATIQIGHLKLLAATRKKICSITLRDIFTYQNGKLFP